MILLYNNYLKMSRSLNEIKNQITTKYVANMADAGYTINADNWSAVNIQRLLIYVVAYCIFIHENLFDTLKTEINTSINEMKPHTRNWYKNKVLNFQYGFSLPADSDVYDNTGISDTAIATSKVVSYCAVTDKADILTIKVAKNNGGDLQALSGSELSALQSYLHQIKDAGVFLSLVNENADQLKLWLELHYNPMLIDASGNNISSGLPTVKNAINNYLKTLQFNGEFSLQTMQDALQAVDGVVYAKISLAMVKATTAPYFQTVNVFYIPTSGYLRIVSDSDLQITFVPYAN